MASDDINNNINNSGEGQGVPQGVAAVGNTRGETNYWIR